MTDDELIKDIEKQRSLMISVATGGPKIDAVNGHYTSRRARLAAELHRRRLNDPNPHGDLWDWYGKWTAGEMSSWQDRRNYVSGLYQPLIDQIRGALTTAQIFEEPTGWDRVDRGLDEIRRRLEEAQNEEQFQAVGLLCREVLISLAQFVYDPIRHPTEDGTNPSRTDAKRMLDAYVAVELEGGANEGARRYAKASLAFANDLQHHRTATFRQATTSVINILAVLAGRRDR